MASKEVHMISLLLSALLAYFDIAGGAAISGEHDNELCESPECLKAATHILQRMDPSVNPCEDFYQFACGKLLTTSTNATKLDRRIVKEMRAILEAKSNTNDPKVFSQVRRLYALCMDEAKIDSRGLDPLVDLLRNIGKWPILEENWSEKDWDLWDVEIKLSKYSLGESLFSISVFKDWQNLSQHQIWITDSYAAYKSLDKILSIFPMRKDESDDKPVERLNETLANFFQKAGVDRKKISKSFEDTDSFKRALKELKFAVDIKETNITSKEDETESPIKRRLKRQYSLSRLQESLPWIDWTKLLEGIMPQSVPLRQDEVFYVNIVGYLQDLEELLNSTPKEIVANYMMWNAIQKLLPYLPSALKKRPKDKEVEERWQHCVNVVTKSSLSLALASMLARNYASLSDTAAMIAKNIQNELVNGIKETEWLDETTRKRGAKKISNMELIMGYPEELVETKHIEILYKEFKMNTTNYFEAMLDGRELSNEFNWARLRLPAKALDWRYDVWPYFTESAFYDPPANIVDVTGPMFLYLNIFDGKLPSYLNYGSLGTVIGHELTHALDTSGIHYNETGGKEDWLSDISMSQFTNKAQCFIKQYSAFNETKLTQMMVDGKNTIGENISDNGGVKLAYRTYRKVAEQLKSPEPKLPGLQQYTPDQLFMLSAASIFCMVLSKEDLKEQIEYDVHAPFEFRVKGEMMNFEVFSRVFNCAEGDPMNPVDKCAVW